MNYLLLIIIFLCGLGFVFVYLYFQKKQNPLDQAQAARQAKKEKAKQQILQLFQNKEQVTNNDVEKLVGVSDATATNYLQELEKQGKIEQKGKTGRGVFYILKTAK